MNRKTRSWPSCRHSPTDTRGHNSTQLGEDSREANMLPGVSTAYLLALLIGCVAGLRTFTAPALVSWAAHLGWLNLSDTSLAFLGAIWTPRILTLLAVGEFVADQLPSMPSRTAPAGFIGRIVSGAISGAAVGTAGGTMVGGLIAGVAGAVIGTLGGHAF